MDKFTIHGVGTHQSLNDRPSLLGGLNYGSYPQIRHQRVTSPPGGHALIAALEAGSSTWRKSTTRWRVNSNTFSLELVTSGNFRFTQDGRVHHLGPGDLFICRPQLDHEMVCTSGMAEKRTVIIGGTMLLHLLTMYPFSELDVIHLADREPVEKVMHAVETHRNSFSQSSGLVMELLERLCEAASPHPLPENVRAIVEYLERHLNADYKELTEHFRLSRATIDRLFRCHLKETPRQFVIRRRIETAKRMLLAANWSIKQIASELGYCDQLYFCRDFHARTGLSPSSYRSLLFSRGRETAITRPLFSEKK